MRRPLALADLSFGMVSGGRSDHGDPVGPSVGWVPVLASGGAQLDREPRERGVPQQFTERRSKRVLKLALEVPHHDSCQAGSSTAHLPILATSSADREKERPPSQMLRWRADVAIEGKRKESGSFLGGEVHSIPQYFRES